MALLFDNDDPNASQGFKNLKAAPPGSVKRHSELAPGRHEELTPSCLPI